jgi:hypothetical protein
MAGGWSNRIGRLTENFISSNSRFALPGRIEARTNRTKNEAQNSLSLHPGHSQGHPIVVD